MAKLPNYLADVFSQVAKNPLKPGGVFVMRIEHDDWCDLYKGGECNCNPIVNAPEPVPDPETPC